MQIKNFSDFVNISAGWISFLFISLIELVTTGIAFMLFYPISSTNYNSGWDGLFIAFCGIIGLILYLMAILVSYIPILYYRFSKWYFLNQIIGFLAYVAIMFIAMFYTRGGVIFKLSSAVVFLIVVFNSVFAFIYGVRQLSKNCQIDL